MVTTDHPASIRIDLLIHDRRGRILIEHQPGQAPRLPSTHAPSLGDVKTHAQRAARQLSAYQASARILARHHNPNQSSDPQVSIVDGGPLSDEAAHHIDHHAAPNLALHQIGAARRLLPEPSATHLRHAAYSWLLDDETHPSNDRHTTPAAPRSSVTYIWHENQPVLGHVPIRQVWGWLITPDGGLLVLLDHRGVASLPGGRPEPDDQDHAQTLRREAAEEAQVVLGHAVHLGWQEVREPGQPPYAQVRLAAAITAVHSSQPDPDSGIHYQRLLVPIDYANFLLGWGPEGDAQATAAIRAAETLGLPHPPTRFPVRSL